MKSLAELARDLIDDTEALRRVVEVKHDTQFWGVTYSIHPRLIDQRFGDGRSLMTIEPMDTRPDYYAVRLDSRALRNPRSGHRWTNDDYMHEVLDEVIEAAEYQFGRAYDEEDDDGQPWPAVDCRTGIGWGRMRMTALLRRHVALLLGLPADADPRIDEAMARIDRTRRLAARVESAAPMLHLLRAPYRVSWDDVQSGVRAPRRRTL